MPKNQNRPYHRRTLLDESPVLADEPSRSPTTHHGRTLLDSSFTPAFTNEESRSAFTGIKAQTPSCAIQTRESPDSIYASLLTFPDGTENLKYFDANPHPEKIPADLLSIWEAAPAPDLNPNLLKKQIEFNLVKDALMPELSDMDKRIMRLPEKMQEWIDNATNECSILRHNAGSTLLAGIIRQFKIWHRGNYVKAALATLENLSENIKRWDCLIQAWYPEKGNKDECRAMPEYVVPGWPVCSQDILLSETDPQCKECNKNN